MGKKHEAAVGVAEDLQLVLGTVEALAYYLDENVDDALSADPARRRRYARLVAVLADVAAQAFDEGEDKLHALYRSKP